MPEWVESLERHGELIEGKNDYSARVREELLAMSPATIDRYLRQEREKLVSEYYPDYYQGSLQVVGACGEAYF